MLADGEAREGREEKGERGTHLEVSEEGGAEDVELVDPLKEREQRR